MGLCNLQLKCHWSHQRGPKDFIGQVWTPEVCQCADGVTMPALVSKVLYECIVRAIVAADGI